MECGQSYMSLYHFCNCLLGLVPRAEAVGHTGPHVLAPGDLPEITLTVITWITRQGSMVCFHAAPDCYDCQANLLHLDGDTVVYERVVAMS